MKKLFLIGFVAACLVSMTSCIDNGDDVREISSFGVIAEYSEVGGALVYYDPLGQNPPLFIPGISDNKDLWSGGRIFFNCVVDMESPANANWSEKGYQTASSGSYEIVSESEAINNGIYPDKDSAVENERVISSMYVASYVRGYLFLTMSIPDLHTNQKNDFYLSWDPELEPEVSGNDRIYSLYLRVVKRTEGVTPLVSVHPQAFDINYFYTTISRKEKEEGRNVVAFKIYYPKELSEDLATVKQWSDSGLVKTGIKED